MLLLSRAEAISFSSGKLLMQIAPSFLLIKIFTSPRIVKAA